jgi:uncharacterized membrane protein
MLEVQKDQDQTLLILSPNRSMSWQTNKKILLAMFIVNMVIGFSFAYLGAWLILPFAGLEIGLFAIAVYYVCWKLNFMETISFTEDELSLHKGIYYPKQSWHWQRHNTVIIRQPSNYRMSPPTLYLQNLNQRVELGQFLNLTEKKNLLKELEKMGLPVIPINSA